MKGLTALSAVVAAVALFATPDRAASTRVTGGACTIVLTRTRGRGTGPTSTRRCCCPATSEGQLAHPRDVISVVRAVPNGRGLGVVHWEPTWYAVPGNGWDPAHPASGDGWDNQALFDWSGRALPTLTAFAG